jgi:hypothetical protein
VAVPIGPLRPISSVADTRIATNIADRAEHAPPVARREYLIREIALALNAAGQPPGSRFPSSLSPLRR